MRAESGRSLIEVIGVLAIGVTMLAAAYGMYKTIDRRQKRLIAYEEIQDVAKKVKTLYAYSGYEGVSITILQQDQAISDTSLPVGTLSNVSGIGEDCFTITITNLTYADCEYFRIKMADWAKTKLVNPIGNTTCSTTQNNPSCSQTGSNQVIFIVE